MNRAKPSILVVEDEAHIRKFLRISLEAHGYEVREARLGEDGLKMCAESAPDLVVLDLGLPDIDGQDFIERLREWSHAPLIVLSVRGEETDKVSALDAGANDYVTKPFGIAEMMARIRALIRDSHESAAPSPVLEYGGLSLDLAQREARLDGEPVHLSRKEYDLLRLLVMNRGRVLTHQAILKQLWGPAQQNETHYLRVLVGQLRQKLGDNPAQPRFIVTVQGIGYRFAGGRDSAGEG